MQFVKRVGLKKNRTIILFHHYLALIFLFLQLTIIFSCRSTSPPPTVIRFDTPGIKKILVLPFKNMPRLFGEDVSVRSPMSGKVFVTGSVEEGAAELMTRLLVAEVSHVESYELIPPEQAWGVASSPKSAESEEHDELYEVTRIGRELGADLVLVGHLFRFKERVGEKYAAESPASAAFDLNLVKIKNGALIWTGHFDETQKALNENLFLIGRFIKRGGVWVTGEEMVSGGIADLVQQLPKPLLAPE